MIIEIKGVQFLNKGASLMLAAILQEINKKWPKAEIALAPNPNSPYPQRAQLGAWQKISIRKSVIDLNSLTYLFPQKARDGLKKYGIVTEPDIDIVLDASGFAYGAPWPERQLHHTANEIERYAKASKPYIFLPQAFGSLPATKKNKAFGKSLTKAALVIARDTTSEKNLKSIMPRMENVFRYPDFTNLVKVSHTDLIEKNHYERHILVIPNSNMLSERNQRGSWKDGYIQLLTSIAKTAQEKKYSVRILNHEGSSDQGICEQLSEALNGCQVINETNPLTVKAIIGASSGIVCSRFHGCVSALSQGVPCLGTSWSHKYEELFTEYGQDEMLLSECDMKKATQLTKILLDPDWQKHCRNNPKIATNLNLSREMWQKAFLTIENYIQKNTLLGPPS